MVLGKGRGSRSSRFLYPEKAACTPSDQAGSLCTPRRRFSQEQNSTDKRLDFYQDSQWIFVLKEAINLACPPADRSKQFNQQQETEIFHDKKKTKTFIGQNSKGKKEKDKLRTLFSTASTKSINYIKKCIYRIRELLKSSIFKPKLFHRLSPAQA